jgi:hypothetical protein
MNCWKLSDYAFCVSTNRVMLQRIFYSLALFTLVLNWSNHILLSQIGPNPLFSQDVDPVYLAFMALRIPQFISGWPAVYFDALLILSCIASIAWPIQRVSACVFLVLYCTYFIVYNMLSGHHYTNVGLLIMSFPFIFAGNNRFVTAFSICRFLLCFMMFSAACWKVVRGNLWHIDQATMMLLATHIEVLAGEVNTGAVRIVRWLIANKYVAHTIWLFLILIESVFILGFINFKWDRLLLAAYLLFFIGGWAIFNIYNFENLLFLMTLTPVLAIINKANNLRDRSLAGNDKRVRTA